MSDAPLTALITQACAGFDRVGVAVSGGGDSVAALILTVDALGRDRVHAVTVDHGLRTGSAAEAQAVATVCQSLGVLHDILRWQGDKSGTLQCAARDARRRLIAAWARNRVQAVILAHTIEDQAETVLLNIARGSGVDGLSAMPARLTRDGVTWLRPLLGTQREALRELLRARGIGWAEDPSNEDLRFDRVRLRQARPFFDGLGLTPETLAALAARMQMARFVLDADAARLFHAHVRDVAGTALIDPAVFDAAPESVERLFASLIKGLTGAPYKPRLGTLRAILDKRSGTLAGVTITNTAEGLRLFREYAAVRDLCRPASEPWDGRWRAQGHGASAQIAPLGEAGVTRLSQQAARRLHPHWRETGLPRIALLAQPGLWYDGSLISAPLAGWPNGWRLWARPLAALFTTSGESH